MTSSTSFSHRTLLAVLLWLALCAGCARSSVAPPAGVVAGKEAYRIAVFPVDNLSGAMAPVRELRQAFIGKLQQAGADILPDEALDQFMARQRLRHTGGIDGVTALALKEELRVDAVLITSLELYNAAFPPRIALIARLVSAAEIPEILWMDSTGMAGDDSPGVFEIGMVRELRQLTDKALGRLSQSLGRYLSGSGGETGAPPPGEILRPRTTHRATLDLKRGARLAVMPFANRSDRKNAAEILALHFVRELWRTGRFHVIEPGVVRRELLQYRVIMEEGVSLANADVIFNVLDADLLLTGKVTEYQETSGDTGAPRVAFSTMLLDRSSRSVVAVSDGANSGDDRVVFFDFGRINTAHGVATGMTRGVVEMIVRPH